MKDFAPLEYPTEWRMEKVKELEPSKLKQIKEQLSKIKDVPVNSGKKLQKMSSAIFRRKLQLFSNNKIDSKKKFFFLIFFHIQYKFFSSIPILIFQKISNQFQ